MMDACHETFVRTHAVCATSHPSSELQTAGDNDVRAGSLGTGVPPGGVVRVWGQGGGIWEVYVPPSQSCCNAKATLEVLKHNKDALPSLLRRFCDYAPF